MSAESSSSYYSSSSSFESEDEDDDTSTTFIIKWSHNLLQVIFEDDNIYLLKKVLKTMTPTEVYTSVGYRCFISSEHISLDKFRCLKYLINRGLSIEAIDKNGNTLLANACLHNHKIMLYLLQKGANPNGNDGTGSILYKYIYNSGADINILQQAYDNGLRIDFLLNESSFAFGFVTKKNFLKVLDFLIDKGFNINQQYRNGDTFFHRAFFYIMSRITFWNNFVRELYIRGFNFDLRNDRGLTIIDCVHEINIRDELHTTLKNLKNDIAYFQKEPECS